MVKIDRGKPAFHSRFNEWDKDQWMDLYILKSAYLRNQVDVSAKAVIEAADEAQDVFKTLGFDSAEQMITEGYDLDIREVEHARQWLKLSGTDAPYRVAVDAAVADAADKRGKHTENRGNRYTIDKLVEDAIEDAADKRGSQQSRNQYQHDQHDSRRTGIARSSTYNPDADNTATAMIRRLARQGHDELIEQIRLGELSPNAAAIQAGFRKRQISVPVGDAEGLMRRLLKHYTLEQLVEALHSVQNSKQ